LGTTWSGFLLWGLGDQSGGIVDSWANACADKDGGGEKSSKSGGDLVLDVAVGHVEVPFWFNMVLHKLFCEDANNIAQAVPV
jgi:hypothetical protein